MNYFNTVPDVTSHLAVAPMTGQYTEIAPLSGHPQAVAPVSVPNYLGGATIMLTLAGMIAMAAQAAGFTSKSATSKHRITLKRSFARHWPHTSH
jgi:hypothetical protein